MFYFVIILFEKGYQNSGGIGYKTIDLTDINQPL